ncbi:MAG: hypothetical protein ACYDCQ_11895, partial [Dehalococcoidia bacterium]
LGHAVYFVEDSDDYPSCYDPSRGVTSVDPAYGLAFARRAFSRLGLANCWAYFDAHTTTWLGPSAVNIEAICRSADVVLNVSGVNPLRSWLRPVPIRVLIDTDPAFTQIRHLTDVQAHSRAVEHTAFFSFGENFGRSGCTVPDDGLLWRPTRQPVVLDVWPQTTGDPTAKFTTVMQWDSYPARIYAGRHFGMKSASFESFADLPARTERVFELALGSATAPRAELRGKGWSVRNPLAPTRDPWTYQRYIQHSRAEFGVAKHGYVTSHSGWFSERSAAYLASARPVLLQDTGFTDWLRAEAGVIAFRTADEAVDGFHDINERYPTHCRAAREVAEHYFDAGTVLTQLLEEAARSSTTPRRTPLSAPVKSTAHRVAG